VYLTYFQLDESIVIISYSLTYSEAGRVIYIRIEIIAFFYCREKQKLYCA
jgi:hypothetical protein